MIDLIKSLIKDWKNKRLYSDPRKLHYAQLREHNKERGVEQFQENITYLIILYGMH